VFETVADMLEQLLKEMHAKGEHLATVFDSLDGLILRNDLKTKKIMDGQKVAGVQLLTKLMFRRLALPINHYDALLIATCQYSSAPQLDPYSKDPARQVPGAGGSSIGHQSDLVLNYGQRFNGDYILENPKEKPDFIKNKQLGVYATVEIKKSSTDVTGIKIKVPIKKGRIGNAIWIEREIVDLMLAWE